MRKFVLVLFLLLGSSWLLAWFSFEQPSRGLPDDPAGRGVLVLGVNSDVGSLDPGYTSATTDLRVLRCLFERLMVQPKGGGAAVCAAAKSVEIDETGLSYQFELRPDARWSNGDSVTARDFRFGWMRAMLPDTGCMYQSLFEVIDGAPEFITWRRAVTRLASALNREEDIQEWLAEQPDEDMLRALWKNEAWLSDPTQRTFDNIWARTESAFDRMVGIHAEGHKLHLRLSRPLPYFLDLVAFSTFSPLHEASMRPRMCAQDEGSVLLKRDVSYFMPETIVSNGPYKLSRWTFSRRMILDAQQHYWNHDAMRNIRVEFRVVPDATLALRQYRAGKLDVMIGLNEPTLVQKLIAQPEERRPEVHFIPRAGTYYYSFNCSPKNSIGKANPFANPQVRKALSMALDRRALVEEVNRLGQPLAISFVPTGSVPGYVSETDIVPVYDPQQARKLLVEAGYGKSNPLPVIRLLISSSPENLRIAEAAAKMWNESLGLKVELDICEFKVYQSRRDDGDFQISRAVWIGDYPDATTFLDMFRSHDANNDGRYQDSEFDALMESAGQIADPAMRQLELAKAEARLLRQVALLPIYFAVDSVLYDPDKLELGLDAWGNLRLELVKGERR